MYDLFFVSNCWARESVCMTCFSLSTGWARESVCMTFFLSLLVWLESQCVGPVFCFYWLG